MEQQRSQSRREIAAAQLDAVLDLLCDTSPDDPIAPRDELALIERVRKAQARLTSRVAVMVADAERRGVSERAVGSSMTSWLSGKGNVSSREAAGVVFAGRDLNAHPELREAAMRGDVSPVQARGITKALDGLPRTLSDAQKEEATSLLVSQASSANGDQLARMGQVVLDAIAPESSADAAEREAKRLDRQRRQAFSRRSLRFTRDDGSVFFQGSLPMLEGEAFVRIIEAYRASQKQTGDDRLDPEAPLLHPEQRNADALVRLVSEHQSRRRGPSVAGDRPRVVVVMREEALRERAEQAGLLGSGEQIAPGDLRRLCCDADLMPAVLGSQSEVLDVGRTERLVTPAIRRALTLRDGGCTFPGCDKPDEQCEAHHIQPWWAGGSTSLENLVLLCAHHHACVEPGRFFPEGHGSARLEGLVPTTSPPAVSKGGPPPLTDPLDQSPPSIPVITQPADELLPPEDPSLTAPRTSPPGPGQDSALPRPIIRPGERGGPGQPRWDKWEVRLDSNGLPEFLPPSRMDPERTPRRRRARLAASDLAVAS